MPSNPPLKERELLQAVGRNPYERALLLIQMAPFQSEQHKQNALLQVSGGWWVGVCPGGGMRRWRLNACVYLSQSSTSGMRCFRWVDAGWGMGVGHGLVMR